jgi:RNA polymerase-binding transcription factor DksA
VTDNATVWPSRLDGTGSVAELAAASLSPRAVLSARWRKQLDELTELCTRLHDVDSGRADRQPADPPGVLRVRIRNARRAMRVTEEALERITQRTYGRCETCGQPIDPLRLIGLPATSVCRRCDCRVPAKSR